MLVIAIDSSTSHCGIAVFSDGKFIESGTRIFEGNWSQKKLADICESFDDFFNTALKKYMVNLVLIEEPLVFAKQSRSIAMLNQVGGAIFATAKIHGLDVEFMHGQKVKKILGYKTKDESIQIAQNTYNLVGLDEHRADAINLYSAYKLAIKSS